MVELSPGSGRYSRSAAAGWVGGVPLPSETVAGALGHPLEYGCMWLGECREKFAKHSVFLD